jgi:peptidyl-prolyl cis-trans isomerase C
MRGQLADRRIAIEAFLAQSGRDETSLRNQIRLEIALNKLLLPQLTSASLEAAFTKHRRDLDGTLVRASHIVLRPDPGRGAEALADLERRAARLRTDILQGTVSFAEAALRHSAGPSRRQGGDVGFFPRHGVMDEEFARQSFALAKGEISKPFATPFGVHLVLVTDLKPGDARPDTLRPQLEKLVVQDAIREIVTRGRQTTPITYAPGVPHFAAVDPGSPSGPRTIVVEPGP